MRPDGRVESAEMGALYPESSPGAGPLPPAVPAGNGSGNPAGGDPGQRGALLRPDEGEQRPAGGAGLHAGRENVVRQLEWNETKLHYEPVGEPVDMKQAITPEVKAQCEALGKAMAEKLLAE